MKLDASVHVHVHKHMPGKLAVWICYVFVYTACMRASEST